MSDNQRCHREELGKSRADTNDGNELEATPTASSIRILTTDRRDANLEEMRKRLDVGLRFEWNCPVDDNHSNTTPTSRPHLNSTLAPRLHVPNRFDSARLDYTGLLT